MSFRVCLSICLFVFLSACMHVCMHGSVCVSLSKCARVHRQVDGRMGGWMHVCWRSRFDAHVFMCEHLLVCLLVCLSVCPSLGMIHVQMDGWVSG